MVSEAQLARMRAAAARSMTGSCQVLRRQRVDDGGGGFVESFVAVAAYPCRMRPSATPVERQEGERVAAVAAVQLVLPWDAEVRATDRLRYLGGDYLVAGSDAGKNQATELVVDASLVA